MADRNRLIILAGPTGVGKTKRSIALAKEVNGEIISADSMQVYKHMDIGTAKIRPEEMQGVRHHLIDVIEPTEAYNVTRFQEMAYSAMDEIYARGHVPVLTGGTGFYIQAVLYGIDFTETDDDPAIRRAYEAEVASGGEEAAMALYARLKQVDPVSAEKIPAQNVKRIIRALEYYDKTGRPISAHNAREREKISPYDYTYYVLTDDRARLYERINARVDQMMADGFLAEVAALRAMGVKRDMTSMQGLGYRELYAHLEGEYDLDAAIDKIKQHTRHFAKRQLTWFHNREKDAVWITRDT